MTRYKTTDVVTIHGGKIKLDAAKAAPRVEFGSLVPLKGGIYEIISPIQFVSGETFEYDGDIPPVIADKIEEVSSKTPPAPTVDFIKSEAEKLWDENKNDEQAQFPVKEQFVEKYILDKKAK